MLTYRKFSKALVDYLTAEFTGDVTIPVEFARYGEMPSKVPCILVFVEPVAPDKEIMIANGTSVWMAVRAEIFCCETSPRSLTESVVSAMELADSVMEKLFNNGFYDFVDAQGDDASGTNITFAEQPFDFDGLYDDIAVAKASVLAYCQFTHLA